MERIWEKYRSCHNFSHQGYGSHLSKGAFSSTNGLVAGQKDPVNFVIEVTYPGIRESLNICPITLEDPAFSISSYVRAHRGLFLETSLLNPFWQFSEMQSFLDIAIPSRICNFYIEPCAYHLPQPIGVRSNQILEKRIQHAYGTFKYPRMEKEKVDDYWCHGAPKQSLRVRCHRSLTSVATPGQSERRHSAANTQDTHHLRRT